MLIGKYKSEIIALIRHQRKIIQILHILKKISLGIPFIKDISKKTEIIIYELVFGKKDYSNTNFRTHIINKIIRRINAKVYLEIGVSSGYCFLYVKAPKKIAVDPNFLKSNWIKLIRIFNFKMKYYRMTSNDFFEKKQKMLLRSGLDVVFLDGLHTHEQSLKDVLNSLKFLNENGIIIMHDCNPMSEILAHPAESINHYIKLNLPGSHCSWCGDVWKTIPFLRAMQKDLKIFVLDCDHGLGVILKGKPEVEIKYSLENIKKFTYKDLEKDRKNVLNLKSPQYLNEFLNTL